MSSRAKKMSQTLTEGSVQGKTKTATFKIAIEVNCKCYYCIVKVSGIPETTPDDDPLIKQAAEQTFINTINSRMFLEVHLPDETDYTQYYPHFINLSKADNIDVHEVEKI